jgi:predicted phosphodiesterase
MRIAVISDMHGNDFAFELVETDIQKQGVDQIVCLGDAIQGGAQPADVVKRLRRLNCPVVMGNADDWMLTGIERGKDAIPEERLKKMRAVREWSLAQLTEDDKQFIASFKPTITLPLENGPDLLCFHASPADYEDVILPTTPEEEFQKFLGAYDRNILTGGHTHTQQIRRCGKNFFFNPGSVGLPFNSYQSGQLHVDSWAEYAILTVEQGIADLQFRRLPFNTNELLDMYRQSGRPHLEDVFAQYQG